MKYFCKLFGQEWKIHHTHTPIRMLKKKKKDILFSITQTRFESKDDACDVDRLKKKERKMAWNPSWLLENPCPSPSLPSESKSRTQGKRKFKGGRPSCVLPPYPWVWRLIGQKELLIGHHVYILLNHWCSSSLLQAKCWSLKGNSYVFDIKLDT